MRYITDFHIHSKYSRACSKDLVPEKLHEWARYKGIQILGTGDFTHPLWFLELEQKLEPAEPGLFRLKPQYAIPASPAGGRNTQYGRLFEPIRFMLTAEVSSIYSQGGRVRRIHTVLAVPSFESAQKISRELANIGNLTSDGRPILGLSAKDLARIVLDVDSEALVIPAHAWTPWFSVFGSMSGFDTLEECYGELTPQIYAIETGLSSDPEMNWRLSALDSVALTSSSDAHSLGNLGREATIFDLEQPSFAAIAGALRRRPSRDTSEMNGDHLESGPRLLGTIEFFPEEGKYHYDGHAACGVVWPPEETKRHNLMCPKCDKRLTVGVMHRVAELADRPVGYQPKDAPASLHIVPLAEIIADAVGVGKGSKKVLDEYWKLIYALGGEFGILLDRPLAELAKIAKPGVVEGIRRVRAGAVTVKPGYDGIYGVVKVFGEGERDASKQASLF